MTGLSMLAMYQKYGEARFHAEEDLMFHKLLQKERCVIATGGTLRLSLTDLEKLKEKNTVIALYLEPEIIHRRLKGATIARCSIARICTRISSTSAARGKWFIKMPIYA